MTDLTLRAQYEQAMRLVRVDELMRAMSTCRRILETYPRHAASYGVLGQVCLQAGQHEVAANLFRRLLSVDPEHPLAYASLGAIYEERGLLAEAVWQLERAFELSPANVEIRRTLKRLYRVTHMADEGPLRMTRAGLARVYLRGGLYPKAIGELRQLLAQDARRPDLAVALAEALWKSGQQARAATVCQRLLRELPNCLKANLLLGHMWLNTEHDAKAREMLQVAQTLDPENLMAQALFGADSPLPPRTVRLPFREEDAPPLDLPYLIEEESAKEEDTVVIEGVAEEVAPGVTRALAAPDPRTPRMDRGHPIPTSDHSRSDARQGITPRASLSEAQVASRLMAARRFASIGAWSQACELYASLLGGDDATLSIVLHDLRMHHRLSPGESRLVTLLAEALARSESRRRAVSAAVGA